ncbi:MAG: D-alanyl-D-alanine carboxypeptidase/D-alanyl-D-alanine-endopeptidase, partial [Cyanobacteria bacterium P01_A01_bin.135]
SETVALRVVGRGDPSFDSEDLQQLAQQVSRAGISQVDQPLIGDERYLGDRFVNPTWDWEDVQAGYGAPVNSLILDENAVGFRLYPQAVGEPLRLEWEQPELAGQWQVVNQTVTVAATEPEFVQVGRTWESQVLTIQGQLRQGAAPDHSAVAVTDPGRAFLRRFRAALREAGINTTLASSLLRILPPSPPSPAPSEAIAAVTSPPLSELLVEVNAHSRNLYAEALVRHLGRTAVTEPTPTSGVLFATGLAQIKAILTPLGVTAPYQIADGSGLSRRSLVTPLALVQTLQAMAQHPHAAAYRHSLAVAGETGTLRSRFRGTPVAGQFWGKSGGLTGVSSLSGYLDPPGYSPVVLSLMVDHSDQSGSTRRQAIDEMVKAIARLTPC